MYRAANQRAVITAIIKKVLQQDPATMASLISTISSSITTDLDVQAIVTLAGQFKDLDIENNVWSAMNPTTSAYVNEIWYEISDEEEWAEMMQRVDQGLEPYTSDTQDVTAGVAATEIEEGTAAADESYETRSVSETDGT